MNSVHSAMAALAMAAVFGSQAAQAQARAPEPPTKEAVVGKVRGDRVAASVKEASIASLQSVMTHGDTTSEQITKDYLARIAEIDRSGPTLRSVISINPDALNEARALDAERKAGHVRGPLHGIPVLIKDNIETLDPIPTTAGSLALKDNITGRDAPLVARLRAAGAVILGKTNLSEWANIRSTRSVSGWSAVGGLVKNPYSLDRNACGSSSGSGAAASASLAAAAVGTETDGSVTCPAALNGLVGLKPTVGLISRTHVVPISHSQDTPGPMTRSVTDAAILLTVMSGTDPDDPATADADAHRTDYAKALDADSLKGKRIGVLRPASRDPKVLKLFDQALESMKAAGAELVDVNGQFKSQDEIGKGEHLVLMTELKADMAVYLATTPMAVTSRTLADLIAFDASHAGDEMPFFGQELFEEAEKTKGLDDPDYKKARETSFRLAGPEGIDRVMDENKLDAIVAPSAGPAWRTDMVTSGGGSGSPSTLPAVSGYPHLTVPMGQARGLPVGLSFIGRKWSDGQLLSLGYAFEQRTHARKAPTFERSVEETPDVAVHLAPAK